MTAWRGCPRDESFPAEPCRRAGAREAFGASCRWQRHPPAAAMVAATVPLATARPAQHSSVYRVPTAHLWRRNRGLAVVSRPARGRSVWPKAYALDIAELAQRWGGLWFPTALQATHHIRCHRHLARRWPVADQHAPPEPCPASLCRWATCLAWETDTWTTSFFTVVAPIWCTLTSPLSSTGACAAVARVSWRKSDATAAVAVLPSWILTISWTDCVHFRPNPSVCRTVGPILLASLPSRTHPSIAGACTSRCPRSCPSASPRRWRTRWG